MPIFEDFIARDTDRDINVPSGANIRVSHTGHLHAFWILDTWVPVLFYEGFNRSQPVRTSHDLLRLRTFEFPIFVSIEEGTIEGGIEIFAPEGAYPGAIFTVTGGTGPYVLVVNGGDTGAPFTSPSILPEDLEMGDLVHVRDSLGEISNTLEIVEYPDVPVNQTVPVVSGYPIAGETLTTTNGTWSGSMLVYTYKWQKNGVDIPGQTTNTLAVNAAEAVDGDQIRSVVSATNVAGLATASSAAVTVIMPPGFIALRKPDDNLVFQPDGSFVFSKV